MISVLSVSANVNEIKNSEDRKDQQAEEVVGIHIGYNLILTLASLPQR